MLIVLNAFTVLGLDRQGPVASVWSIAEGDQAPNIFGARIGMPGPQTVLATTLCFAAMCICQPKPEARVLAIWKFFH